MASIQVSVCRGFINIPTIARWLGGFVTDKLTLCRSRGEKRAALAVSLQREYMGLTPAARS